MNTKAKLTISLLAIISCFAFAKNVHAATEFISIIDPDNAAGTDYTSLAAWQLKNHVDLTAGTTLVFSYDASSGTIADEASVSTDGGASTATLVHETADQILLSGISGSFDDNDVVTDGSNTVTLSNSGDDAISVASCRSSNGAADTAAVTIDGWTTNADNYIKIWTDPSLGNRHNGKWDEGKYRLEVSNVNEVAWNYEDYTIFEGIQIENSRSGATGGWTVIHSAGVTTYIDKCILRWSNATGNSIYGAYFSGGGSPKITNSVVYNNGTAGNGTAGNGTGIFCYSATTNLLAYNNTVYGCYYGIRKHSGTFTIKNSAVFNNADDFNGTMAIDYCASDDGDGTNAVDISPCGIEADDWEDAFTDYSNADFHIKDMDSVLYDAGDDLTSEGFTTDIDSDTRPTGSWDIGADEFTIPIYRSVGPSATSALDDDNSHNDTLTISSGTATFSSAAPDNVGVGDVVLYDSNNDDSLTSADSIAFIKSRTDSTHYILQTETGATPADLSANDTWAIYRAYTSLANAEAGTENTSIPISFTGGNRDLVTNNEQWNIACYANGTTADITAVTIDGWTTGENNYIKVHTPTETTEVGISQRHSGVWDEGKYRLDITDNILPIYVNGVPYVHIEGLQIHIAENKTGIRFNLTSNGDMYVGSCIIKNSGITSAYDHGILFQSSGISTGYAWNNIIYDFILSSSNSGISIRGENVTGYIYNNTIFNCYYGINDIGSPNGNIIAKNNIVQSCINGYNGTFDASSDYNISDVSQADADDVNATFDGYKTVSFTDSTNDDFHLSSSDTSAKDAGTDLSSDSYLSFSTDIDGDTRPSPYWDIGADEYPATVKVEFKGITEFLGNVEIR